MDHRNDDYNTAYDNGDEHVMMNKRMRLRGILIFGHQLHLQKNFLREYILRVQCPVWRWRRLSYGGAQAPAGQIRRRKPPRNGLPWLGLLGAQCANSCANALSITIPAKDLLLTKRHFLARWDTAMALRKPAWLRARALGARHQYRAPSKSKPWSLEGNAHCLNRLWMIFGILVCIVWH